MALSAVIITLLVLLGIATAASVFAIALARRSKAQLEANLKPAPGMPAGAPKEWAGAHTPEAKLHRRLVGLARALVAVPLGDAASIERRVEVEVRIRELDQRLIDLAVAPEGTRRAVIADMGPEVVATEADVAALATERPLD